MRKAKLKATWASHSIIERALAYYRVRLIGDIAIFLALLVTQFIRPSAGPLWALAITSVDIIILLWQRAMTYRGKPKFATWISLIAASVIGTIGLHLGGGFITLSLGIYLILILTAALVFRSRSASYTMAVISGSLYLLLVIAELSNLLRPNNYAFLALYDFREQSRVIIANVSLGLILILLTMLTSGEAAEILGQWTITLTKEIEEKNAQHAELLEKMQKTYTDIVSTLADTIEIRDHYTNEHSERIALLAKETAKVLECDDEFISRLHFASILHDVGKIGIPDHILNKPGLLAEEERITIQKHPIIGEKIIRNIEGLKDIASVIRSHHEKFDGTGYPDGLKGEEIPFAARIIAVVDAYIAITDERPYKPSKSSLEAQKKLIINSSSQFDPQVVDAFLYAIQINKANLNAPPLKPSGHLEITSTAGDGG